MIKLVVFDIAGTTLQDDNVVNNTFKDAFMDVGLSPSEESINKVMGLSKPVAISIILKELNLAQNYNSANILFSFLKRMNNYYSNNSNIKEIYGVSDVFSELRKRNIKVGIDTGFDSNITSLIMNGTGWKNLVDAYISSDMVSHGRPYPYMIFELMKTLHIQSVKEVMKVGDTISDIMEGINAGCDKVIGVTSGTCSEQDFQKCSEIFNIVPDITNIFSFII